MYLNIRCIEITEFATHMAEKATTTGYGHTILNPTITSTSHAEAATASAVKAVADIANSKAPASHTHAIGQVTGLEAALNGKVNESTRNKPNGFVGLDGSGKLPEISLPSTTVKSASGFYVGDDTNNRFISIGFTPKVLIITQAKTSDGQLEAQIIMNRYQGPFFRHNTNSNYGNHGRIEYLNGGFPTGITDNGFIVSQGGGGNHFLNGAFLTNHWTALG